MSAIGHRRARTSTLERRRAVLHDAQSFMARELSRALSLKEVASEIATSPRQLQRVFAAEGTTFRARLRHLRMQRAIELLREGQKVEEAATAVGYASTPAFTRAFIAIVGRSPGARPRSSAPDTEKRADRMPGGAQPVNAHGPTLAPRDRRVI